MKKKKSFRLLVASAMVAVAVSVPMLLTGCTDVYDHGDEWKTKFDITLPDFANMGGSADTANSSGWYTTLNEEFDNGLGDIFGTEKHYLRKVEYWCDKQVSVKDGKVEIRADKSSNYVCDSCPSEGIFTGGITSSKFVDGVRVPTFEQAFGYFEATVKFPNTDGMWSAFWLQCESMNQVGNDGRDGSEIDIYESSFWNKKTSVGNCIHWDGYEKSHHSGATIRDAGKDLYDGYHTFGLKWTPNEYVFFVDGVALWATNYGGVSRVPEYIKLTNEVRPYTYGPYGQKLGDLAAEGGTFYIESVKVYQNKNYLPEIRTPQSFLK